MKIVIAPDSFKDALSSKEAAQTILKAFQEENIKHKYISIPISDGGEGLISVLADKTVKKTVTGPFKEPIETAIGFLKDYKTIIIEMALVAGLEKIEFNKRDANFTTTYGIGELLIKSLEYNPKRIVLGLGGSATNDLGIGALKALGINFYDNEKEVGVFGKDIFKIKKVDITQQNKNLENVELILATDVKNTLLGINGSTFVYGPQKGIKEKDLAKYDRQFKAVSDLLNEAFKKDLTEHPGSGAAGGIAYSLATCFNGKIISGFDFVYQELKIEEQLKNANYLITGEGKTDEQTLSGKAPFQIALKAKKINPNIKVILFTGTNVLKDNNVFDKVVVINDENLSLKENIKLTKSHLYLHAKRFIDSL